MYNNNAYKDKFAFNYIFYGRWVAHCVSSLITVLITFQECQSIAKILPGPINPDFLIFFKNYLSWLTQDNREKRKTVEGEFGRTENNLNSFSTTSIFGRVLQNLHIHCNHFGPITHILQFIFLSKSKFIIWAQTFVHANRQLINKRVYIVKLKIYLP